MRVAAPEINLIDGDVYQRGGPPHEQFSWLREHAPVFWHANNFINGIKHRPVRFSS
jgi:hypothetical protein